MKAYKVIFILSFVFLFGGTAFAIFNQEEKVVGKQLCVDGYRNKNLEGIMCEKIEFRILGYHYGYYTAFLMITFLLLFSISLTLMSKEELLK